VLLCLVFSLKDTHGFGSDNSDEFLDFLGMQHFVYGKESVLVTEVKTEHIQL